MVAQALIYWPNDGAFGPSVPQPPNLTFLWKLQYTVWVESSRSRDHSRSPPLTRWCSIGTPGILFQEYLKITFVPPNIFLPEIQYLQIVTNNCQNWVTLLRFKNKRYNPKTTNKCKYCLQKSRLSSLWTGGGGEGSGKPSKKEKRKVNLSSCHFR